MSYDIILIGASQGSLTALETIFRCGVWDLLPPIALVLHRPAASGSGLRNLLHGRLPFDVVEPDDKQPLQNNCFFLAPAGYHMLVDREGFHLSTEAPVLHSRPSIDVLFESAAFSFGSRALGVILTGASADGAQGAARLAECGGRVLIQDPASATSPTLPQATLQQLGSRASVLSLEAIGVALAACRLNKEDGS